MKKFFLIPLMTLVCCVMAWAVEVSGLQALKDAVTAGGEITLAADIDGGTNPTITIASGKTVTLDLNGHRLYASATANGKLITNNGNLTIIDSQNGHSGIIENTYTGDVGCLRFIENAGTLWVKKGQLIAQSEMCINVQTGATLIVGTEGGSNDDVLIESKSNAGKTNASGYPGAGENDAVAMTLRANSNTTIYCGTIKSATHPSIYALTTANLNIQDGMFLMNPDIAPAWLDGGSIDFITISGGSYSTTPEKYLDQTHRAILNTNNNLFEVIEILAPRDVTVYNSTDIVEAINGVTLSQAVNMTLGADITLDQNIELPHGSALNIPAGKTLTVPDDIVFVNEGATTNNGEIIILGTGFFSKPTKVEGNGAFTMSGYTKNEVAGVVNYAISTPMQLQYIGYLALQDEYADKTWNIVLNTDLSMPTNANFESILEVQGTFDGQKHAINNLTGSGLFTYFKGNIKNLTMNNLNLQGGAALCDILKENSIIENVTLNGSNTATTSNACGFVGNAEVIETAGNSYGMRQASDYIWFVNCVNNVTLYTQKGWFPASFIGTITGAKGKVGIYNCKNTANITGDFLYAGAAIGYGSSASTARVEFINFENTGTITAPTEPLDFCEVADLIGANMEASKVICDKIDPATWTAVYNESTGKYEGKEAGTLDNKNTDPQYTDWATAQTWTASDDQTNVVPNEADNVKVSKDVEVNDGTDAVANSVIVEAGNELTVKDGATLTIGEDGLQIADGATVTVEEGATLVVGKDGITGDGELIVKATQAGGTGVVLVDPAAAKAKARPEAKIELIPDAHFVSGELYKYRYIGIPLYFEESEEFVKATNWEVSDPGATIYFKQWNNGAWEELTAWNQLVPFKGYATSNSTTNNLKYTFKGKLIGNGDGTMNFTYGFNLFANSYTAPINIQTLLNGLVHDNVKATIYMFEEDKLRTVSKADFAGFRTPRFTVIPSLQAFFVLMDDGTSATEDINYAEAVYNNSLANGPLYAPKHQEAPAFNRVRINIAAENGASDEVYLIEAADYTSDFENGFDEVKYMNNGLNLYATTAYGRQSTKISNDLNGTFIGVQGNGTYTLIFDELVGEEYQIRDLQTNAVVAMSEANTYTFTTNGTNDARFVVESIAKMPTALNNVDAAKMFINNNTLYISENNTNANIMIYAANGQLVLNEVAQPTVSLNGLASGVYTVRVANQTLKFVK